MFFTKNEKGNCKKERELAIKGNQAANQAPRKQQQTARLHAPDTQPTTTAGAASH
jgi:hypothetical protein